jgi:hypothetical protein
MIIFYRPDGSIATTVIDAPGHVAAWQESGIEATTQLDALYFDERQYPALVKALAATPNKYSVKLGKLTGPGLTGNEQITTPALAMVAMQNSLALTADDTVFKQLVTMTAAQITSYVGSHSTADAGTKELLVLIVRVMQALALYAGMTR